MKSINFRLLFITLAILSLFSGIAINGQWALPYQLTFISLPEIFLLNIKNKSSFDFPIFIIWIFMFISHIIILLLPFIKIKSRYLKPLLVYAPAVFLLSQFLVISIFAILFIPFILIWIILLFNYKKTLNRIEQKDTND